jgi:hypothetical protein
MKATAQGGTKKVVELAKTVFNVIGGSDVDTAIAALRIARNLLDHREGLRLTRITQRFDPQVKSL